MIKIFNKYRVLHCLCALAIVILCCINIENSNYIAVLNDEFGYWSNAAAIAGYDWRSLIAETPYYSLGYSLLLVPIIILFPTPYVWYKAAIILNICLLIASYLLFYFIGRKIFPDVNKRLTMVLSLLTVIYPSNITYAQVAWSETLLYFLIICITACIVKMLENFSYKWLVLMISLMLYSYFTHARSIGTIIAGCLVILIILMRQKKRVKLGILTIGILIFGYFGIKLISDIQISTLWENSVSGNMNVLNVNSNTIEVYFMRFVQNAKLFVESLGGKFLYLVIGTGFVFLYTTLIAIKNTLINIKEKKSGTNQEIVTFWSVILTWLMLGFSALQMLSWTNRKDIIVYSRYMEHTLGPIIFLGLMLLCNQKILIKTNTLLAAGLIFLGLRSVYYRVIEADSFFNSICSPIFGAFYDNSETPEIAFALISVVCIIYIILFLITLLTKKAFIKNVMLIVPFFIIWIFIGIASNTYMNNARESFERNILETKNNLDNYEDLDIYYLKDTEHDLYSANPKYLQFMIPEQSIQVIEEDELATLKGECLILANPQDARMNKYANMNRKCFLVSSNAMLSLFKLP